MARRLTGRLARRLTRRLNRRRIGLHKCKTGLNIWRAFRISLEKPGHQCKRSVTWRYRIKRRTLKFSRPGKLEKDLVIPKNSHLYSRNCPLS